MIDAGYDMLQQGIGDVNHIITLGLNKVGLHRWPSEFPLR